MRVLRMLEAAALIACLNLLAGACATNPATGHKQLSLISESQEIAMGRDANQEIAATIGIYADRGLNDYVDRIGQELARHSERPQLPWSFQVADDPSVNAFALPGGFIYVTRGILAHFESEAELAGVLGHELGHVTARHSVNQISKAQLATLGLGIGMIVEPELQQFGDIASTGLGLLFLKFGRDDEREADLLGVRYMVRAGYNPWSLSDVFDMLRQASQLESQGRMPDWLSTHPNPEDRVQRISAHIEELGVDARQLEVGREAFVQRLDGLVYGADPRQGFFEDGVFKHPEMRFRMSFPRGWRTTNQQAMVGALSPSEDALVRLTLARERSAEAAAEAFFGQAGVQRGRVERARIGGLPAVIGPFQARTQSGELRGLAAFVEHQDRVLQLLGLTLAGRWSRYARALEDSIESFDRLTERRALEAQPMRIEVMRLSQPMSVSQLARRYGSPISLEKLALLNRVDAGGQLESGRLVKRVTGQLYGDER